MIKPGKTLFLIICLTASLAACQKQDTASGGKGPAEQVGQQLDQTTARVGEQLNKAAEKAGQGLQEAGRQLQDKAAEAQKNNEKNEQ